VALFGLAAVAGVGMFFLGAAVGGSFGDETTVFDSSDAGSERAANSEILAKLDKLSREVRQLREAQDDDARNTRRRERVDPATAQLRVASPTELTPGEREILERLKSLETTRSTWASPQQFVYDAVATKLERPQDLTAREFLATLKSQNNDVVKRAHANWSPAQVQQEYGMPDAIMDRDSYIEWIYYIEDEPSDGSKRKQFDFHFTNDRCDVAH